ncbi:MAG: Outer membrane protein W precursor [uncultured Caballeronia sp.]|nr:MAG: Outer membrane protein W precursor [uncultured Caballeronia sp.]
MTVMAALLISTAAHAQSAGDVVANLGWFHLSPQDSSKPLTVSALGTRVRQKPVREHLSTTRTRLA